MIPVNSFNVIDGCCAVAVPGGWKGVIVGNHWCKECRDTSEDALRDAEEKYALEVGVLNG